MTWLIVAWVSGAAIGAGVGFLLGRRAEREYHKGEFQRTLARYGWKPPA